MDKPTVARLRELLTLDPETGALYWRVGRPKAPKGGRAGSFHAISGYRVIRVDNNLLYEHRVVWALIHGQWPIQHVDHINRNRADNRPANLRAATRSQQNANSTRRRDNTSGHKGVSYCKRLRKYLARCKIRGRDFRLGWYETAEEAAEAASEARKRLHGSFACDG